MKITAVRGIPVESNLIVKVETDEGLYGIGEAGMAPQIPATMKVLEYYQEWLVGRDPGDIELIWQELFRHTRRKEGIVLVSAISGIDVALWDIKGKACGLPVWSLLGGRARQRVQLYAHVQGSTLEATVERARRAAGAGYGVLRFGLDDPGVTAGAGAGPKGGPLPQGFDPGRAIRHTVAAAEALRTALGDEIELCVDVHQRLSPPRAVEFCNAMTPTRPLFVEDPVRPEDPSAYTQIRGRTGVPLATGENLYSKWQFRQIVEQELADYLRIDIALVGGLTEARKVAAMGEAHFLDVVPHCARGPVLDQAALHFSLATPNIAVQEHIDDPPWWGDVLAGIPDYSRGWVEPPVGPGLGLELDEREAAKHPFVQRQMPRWHRPDGSVQDW